MSTAVTVVRAALEGDRVVVGFAHDGARGFTIDGELIEDSDEPGFFLAWVDDGGVFRDVFRLKELTYDAAFAYADLDVAAGDPGHVRVAAIGAGETFQVIDVNLCDRSERLVVDCSGAAAQSAQMEGDSTGGWAFAFNSSYGAPPTCDTFPGDCVPPSADTILDTFIWRIDSDGECSSTVIHDSIEDRAETNAFQTATTITLTPEGDVLAVGHYDGKLFDGNAAIDTNLGYFEEDDDFAKFHKFFVRLHTEGDDLIAVQAFDLGGLPAAGSHRAQPLGLDVRIAASVNTNIQPGGPFDPPPSALTPVGPVGESDVILIRATPAGGTPIAQWRGSTGADVLSDLTRSSAGQFVAFTAYGSDVSSTCPTYGCGFFAFIDDSDTPGASIVIDATEPTAIDVAHSAFAVEGGDAFLVGSTTGTLDLTGRDAPAAGTSMIYVARRPRP